MAPEPIPHNDDSPLKPTAITIRKEGEIGATLPEKSSKNPPPKSRQQVKESKANAAYCGTIIFGWLIVSICYIALFVYSRTNP